MSYLVIANIHSDKWVLMPLEHSVQNQAILSTGIFKGLLGQYLKMLSSWERTNSGWRSSDSHSRGAHRYTYLGCSCTTDLEGQSDPFKSAASVDRID